METVFSSWLNAEMGKASLNQSELAKRANINQAAVSRLLAGTTTPSAETCNAIAKALKLPPEQVYRAAGLLPPKSEHDELVERAEHMLRSFKTEQYRQIALATLEALLVQEEKGGYNANGMNPATSQPKP